MVDEQKLRHATHRFRLFRSHVSGLVSEKIVAEYHSILGELEKGAGTNLSSLRIDPYYLRPHRLPEVRMPRGHDRFTPQFTAQRFCDKEVFHRTLNRLAEWIEEYEARKR
jgi:hypothetical protein